MTEQSKTEKRYIGTKTVLACSMTRLGYNILRGWTLPENENGDDAGFLLEDTEGAANTENFSGYVSWLPASEFERTYAECALENPSAMSFGLAIEALKNGERVARAGWNGKGMWLSLSCGPGGDAAAGRREIAAENFWSSNNSEYARQNGGSAVVLPCITMKTATGEILMGWLASQTDMLAEDWQIVE